ncbi:hypothetical protein FRB90_001516 [Tulasnella sp. 427]|nr:hypothetical protein FRB90_001516 [Tulasnella sp. 427]
MKLTLRPEWRPRPLTTFLGFVDIKTGVKIAILFAVINKVAGVYGLLAMLTGAGGSLAQLSMYLYSVIALAAYVVGFKAAASEDIEKVLLTAHFFFVDHFLNSIWLAIFAVDWWAYNPHDGKHAANSPAQQEVADVGPGKGVPMTDAERYAAAQELWNKEKGTAALVLAAGWIIKLYFAALLYSYAIHLRRGTYKTLPLTIASAHRDHGGDDYSYQPVYENELDARAADHSHGGSRSSRHPVPDDIDFEVDFDAGDDDLERGRAKGRRPGSLGGYGEMISTPSRGGQGKPSVNNASKLPTPKTSPDKGKSRAIQQELERGNAVDKWDDDEDDDIGLQSTGSRSRTKTVPVSPVDFQNIGAEPRTLESAAYHYYPRAQRTPFTLNAACQLLILNRQGDLQERLQFLSPPTSHLHRPKLLVEAVTTPVEGTPENHMRGTRRETNSIHLRMVTPTPQPVRTTPDQVRHGKAVEAAVAVEVAEVVDDFLEAMTIVRTDRGRRRNGPPRRYQDSKQLSTEEPSPKGSPAPVDSSLPSTSGTNGPGQHTSRRQRFGAKLTTSEAQPLPTPPSPKAKATPIVITKDMDLTSRLTASFSRSAAAEDAPECPICFNSISPGAPTWSCTPAESNPKTYSADPVHLEHGASACCWTTFHLKCIKAWASKSVTETRDAYVARGLTERSGEWRCPGCQTKRSIADLLYLIVAAKAAPGPGSAANIPVHCNVTLVRVLHVS